jgi:hypothetical protein
MKMAHRNIYADANVKGLQCWILKDVLISKSIEALACVLQNLNPINPIYEEDKAESLAEFATRVGLPRVSAPPGRD